MFFIDSCVFIGFYNIRDERHSDAKALVEEALKGGLGAAYTSDYVLDEAVTLIKKRTGSPKLVAEAIDFIQNSGRMEILHIDREVFASAKMCMEKYPQMPLSFTDWTIANLMASKEMEYLLSFDSGFDRLRAIETFSNINRIEKL
jgi:predicted nucleic acid-binding protein